MVKGSLILNAFLLFFKISPLKIFPESSKDWWRSLNSNQNWSSLCSTISFPFRNIIQVSCRSDALTPETSPFLLECRESEQHKYTTCSLFPVRPFSFNNGVSLVLLWKDSLSSPRLQIRSSFTVQLEVNDLIS